MLLQKSGLWRTILGASEHLAKNVANAEHYTYQKVLRKGIQEALAMLASQLQPTYVGKLGEFGKT